MTDVPEGVFKLTPLPTIAFGRGAVRNLKEELERLGGRRALLMTVPYIEESTDLADKVKTVLGDRLAGVFSGVIQHVPRQCVIEGARMARQVGADSIVSLGGSSFGAG